MQPVVRTRKFWIIVDINSMIIRHWRQQLGRGRVISIQRMEALMKRLWFRVSRWFHSFDETNDDLRIVIRTAEDGARVGMVGWY